MSEITPASASPFEALRRVDQDGEFWSARELMGPLGYEKWERFEDAIERAKIAACNSGHDCETMFRQGVNFPGAGKVSRGPTPADYRLTRLAAYLLAMNGDPRKTEVAAAQSYFAIRTREAETRVSLPVTLRNPALQQIVDVAIQMQITQDEQARLAAVQHQHGEQIADLATDVADLKQVTPLVGSADLMTLRDTARACGEGQNRFARWLRDTGIMFYDHDHHLRVHQDWINSGLAVEKYEQWQHGEGWSWVTRFTTKGVASIRRRRDEG